MKTNQELTEVFESSFKFNINEQVSIFVIVKNNQFFSDGKRR